MPRAWTSIFFPSRPLTESHFRPRWRVVCPTWSKTSTSYIFTRCGCFLEFAGQWAARRAGVPYVVSPHGALDPYLRQHGRLRKALTDAAWQRRMLRNAVLLHITTEQEGELIKDIAPCTPRYTVPVGVWTVRFQTAGRRRSLSLTISWRT